MIRESEENNTMSKFIGSSIWVYKQEILHFVPSFLNKEDDGDISYGFSSLSILTKIIF